MHLLAPYNTSYVLRIPLVKRNVVDLAIKADYTPANADVNVSKDGGAQFNPQNNLNIVTGTTWNVTLNANDMTAQEVVVMVRNNTAVEDQWATIRTFGSTSAYYGWNMQAANLPADLRQIVGAAVSGPLTAGVLDVNVKNVNNVAANTNLPVDLRQIVGAAVSGPATAGVLDVNIKNVNNAVHNTNLAQYGASLVSVVANAITAAAFNANAITGSKVANDVDIRSVTGNVGNVTGGVGGSLAGSVGSVVNNVTTGTIANNAINELAFDQTAGSFNPLAIIDQGIAQNTSATSIKIRSAAPFNANEIVGAVVSISTGTGRGQTRSILSYNNANNTAAVAPWTTTPNANTPYKIFAIAPSTDDVIGRLNANLALGNQTFTLTGSITGNVGNVSGNVGGNIAGNLDGSIGSITANVAKQLFNLNSTTNYAGSVAGSVVKEIADNAGGSSLTVDAIIARLNSNVVVNAVVNNVGNVTGDVGGSIGAITANVAKQFFNLNSGTNFAASVAGSVVNEIATNAGGTAAPTVDQILGRLNSNLALGNQTFTLTGSVTGNVGNVTGDIGGNVAGSVGNVTGSVTGSVGSVTGSVGSVTGNVGNVTGNLGGTVANVVNLNAQLIDAAISTRATPAQVKTQVVDGLATDTYAEPGQGNPAATTTLSSKINYLYKSWRNKITQTNNTLSIFADDAVTVDQKASVSDVNNVFTRGEISTGP
jgi:hypothetical protein